MARASTLRVEIVPVVRQLRAEDKLIVWSHAHMTESSVDLIKYRLAEKLGIERERITVLTGIDGVMVLEGEPTDGS